MNWMATKIDRRRLLAGVAAAAGLTLTGRARGVIAATGPLWLSAYAAAGAEAAFGVAGFGDDGRLVFRCPLPGRAHGVTPHPDGRMAVVMARRPGRWFAVLDLASGRLAGPATALPDDRRGTGHGVFDAGHGVFDADGAVFYMAEDDVTRETGVLTVLDPAAGYARRESFDVGGVGPHEVIALDNGRTLVSANGGVLTHPDTGRVKLNLEDMDPSLSYLDAARRQVTEVVRLPAEYGNLGIRHLAALADGAVAFGMQDERPTGEIQPLVGLHRRGQPPALLAAPDEAWRRMAGYIGDVASDGRVIAASSPRGGVVGRWDGQTGAWLGLTELSDGCGLAARADGGFVATSGHGRIIALSGDSMAAAVGETPDCRWDNHLSRV